MRPGPGGGGLARCGGRVLQLLHPTPPPTHTPSRQPRDHAQRVSLSSGRQPGPWHLGPVHPPSSLIIALRSLPTSPKRKLPRPWSLPTRLSMLYSPLSLASLHHRTLLHAPTADTGLLELAFGKRAEWAPTGPRHLPTFCCGVPRAHAVERGRQVAGTRLQTRAAPSPSEFSPLSRHCLHSAGPGSWSPGACGCPATRTCPAAAHLHALAQALPSLSRALAPLL